MKKIPKKLRKALLVALGEAYDRGTRKGFQEGLKQGYDDGWNAKDLDILANGVSSSADFRDGEESERLRIRTLLGAQIGYAIMTSNTTDEFVLRKLESSLFPDSLNNHVTSDDL